MTPLARHRPIGAMVAIVLLAGGCSGADGPTATSAPHPPPRTPAVHGSAARPDVGAPSGPRTVGDLLALTRTAIQAAGSVHLHVEQGQADGQQGRTTIDADVRMGRRPAYSMIARASATPDEVISADGIVYYRGGSDPAGKKWSHLPQRDYYQSIGAAALDADGIMDVCRSIVLGSCGLSPNDLGQPVRQTSRGHFTIRYTRAQWLAKVPQVIRKDVTQWADSVGVTEVDLLLALDERNRPVQLIATARPSTTQLTFEIDYSRWGAPLNISAPSSATSRRAASSA